ncbi:MAG: haloacid dehalogenase-like hydrolase [Verrucomicrobiota bacterium]|nr:haloacid dehalogenase-like hydrolase [Verrucomicrobiota bacterium]
MRIINLYLACSTLLLIPTLSPVLGTEPHVEKVVARILQTRQAILAQLPDDTGRDALFLTFWDFDGTLLEGDCTEGLPDAAGDGSGYKGLAQACIEAGLSSIYPAEDGYSAFKADYGHMDHAIGRWLAYPYVGQMLRGAEVEAVRRVVDRHFEEAIRPFYYDASMKILRALEAGGVECHILSASIDLFVDAAASSLELPVGRFNGIELRITDGKLTEQIEYPITWADGKTERLQSIATALRGPQRDRAVFILGAFGNSYGTDGPFMKHVAAQQLPVGKPIALMINGGTAPAAYQGLFWEVEQTLPYRAQ